MGSVGHGPRAACSLGGRLSGRLRFLRFCVFFRAVIVPLSILLGASLALPTTGTGILRRCHARLFTSRTQSRKLGRGRLPHLAALEEGLEVATGLLFGLPIEQLQLILVSGR